MKPTKTQLNKGMLALLIGGAIFFASCQKEETLANDDSATSTTTTESSDESVSARASNKAPVAKAGADQSITLPVSTATLDGSNSSDPDGSIRTYAWTKEVGPNVTITSPAAAKTTVTGFTAGEYRFKLKVTDNAGGTATDTVHVSVKGSGGSTPPPTGGNQAPVVNAGVNQTVTLPISSVTLSGSATDADGTVASYLWTVVSGTGSIITSPTVKTTTVTGLRAGTYVFNLKATDNAGASGNKTVTVTVNSGSTTPPPTSGSLIYSNNYDKSSDINSNQLGSGSVSTSVYKIGPGSFKSVVPAGSGQISGGWRSEQQYTESYSPNNTAITVSYDMMFENLPNVAGLATQWHGNTSGTSGQLSLWTQGGKFMVMRNTTGTAGSPNIYQSGNLMSIQTGRWYSMKWEIKFTSGSDGYVRLYIDGALYFSVTGKTSDGSGQYLKIGQNLFASPSNNSTLYFDNLKIYK
jgi:hypothetical protein